MQWMCVTECYAHSMTATVVTSWTKLLFLIEGNKRHLRLCVQLVKSVLTNTFVDNFSPFSNYQLFANRLQLCLLL